MSLRRRMRISASRSKAPGTNSQEAVSSRLRLQSRKARQAAIASYAAEAAGTLMDLDIRLETAGIEHLLKTS